MMWFFAVLVVLSLGAVAAVAAGRGRPMAVEYDDRPDVTVPADRPLVEDDVRRVRFTTALLGYRQSEVDALLDRLARELGERSALEEEAAQERAEEEQAAEESEALARLEAAASAVRSGDPVEVTESAATAAATPAAGRTWWSRRRAGSRPRSG